MTTRKAKLGDWLVECDVCGFTMYASKALHGVDRQKGLILCKQDYDEVNMQDHLKGKTDKQKVPFVRNQTTVTNNLNDPYDPDESLPTSDLHTTHTNESI